MALKNVDYFLSPTMNSLEMKDGRIHAVQAMETANGTLKRFTGTQFLDSTGDGWLGHMSGCEYRYGRESKHEFNEEWEEHGELWSPEKPDNRVMGSSVMWYTRATNKRVKFPAVPWAKTVAKNYVATEGEWQWEYSHNDLHQVYDAETIRDHMFRAIYGSYDNAIKRRQNANLGGLDILLGGQKARVPSHSRRPYLLRRGCSRLHRISGFSSHRKAEDRRSLPAKAARLSGRFQIRSDFPGHQEYVLLYSLQISVRQGRTNLQMAGRCFSCTHIGLGGPRVMNTCGQMGVATGYAAGLCKKYGKDPRQIGKDHIRS